MIDAQTNTLYLSPLLKEFYPRFWKNFKIALEEANVQPRFLEGTKDVWCVDFMPIQIGSNRFIQFVYDPLYLKKQSLRKYVSNPNLVTNKLGIDSQITSSDIVLDGGNVVRYNGICIMTTRIFIDNPNYSEAELIRALTELLELDQLIVIPEQPDDPTGHSDGMVRFLDRQTVLINDYSKDADPNFQKELHGCLREANLELVTIPTSMYDNRSCDDATGDYINFIQMDGVVFLPVFNRRHDNEVIRRFEGLFPKSSVIPVESSQLSKDGGVLNCVSWNICL